MTFHLIFSKPNERMMLTDESKFFVLKAKNKETGIRTLKNNTRVAIMFVYQYILISCCDEQTYSDVYLKLAA